MCSPAVRDRDLDMERGDDNYGFWVMEFVCDCF